MKEWKTNKWTVEGLLDTDWLYPVVATVVFPFGTDGYKTEQVKLIPNQKRFRIELD